MCYSLHTAAKSLQSCPTLCDPIDGSPPGSAIPGILQVRTLEWAAIAFSALYTDPQLNSFNKRTSMLNLKCIEYSFSWLCTSISSVLMESSVIINLNYLLVITITSPNTVLTRCYVWSWELCAHCPIISSVYRWRRQKVKVLVAQSCPILWIIAFQAPLSMEFSRQEN